MPRQQLRLSDAIDEFMAHRKAQGFAANTLRSQQTALMRLLTSVGNIYVDSIEQRHIDGFFAANADIWSSATANLMRAHVSSLFRWCRARRVMHRDADPMSHTRYRPQPTKDRFRVPVTEFGRLLDTAKGPRNRMVIALGLFLFLRASELRSLRIKDVHLDLDEITVTVHKQAGSVDQMPISRPLREELNRWLTYYTTQVGVLAPDVFLVPGMFAARGYYDYANKRIQGRTSAEAKLNPSKPISDPQDIIHHVLNDLGYPSFREGCHTLRRSGARALFDEIADSSSNDRALEIVSSMLHHKHMSTTQIYLGLAESRVRRDALLKGRAMFTNMTADNVVQLVRAE